MESTPYFSFINRLTKRQPMVVSSIAACRLKAASALAMTKGARDMLSTPPAIIRLASPAFTARAEVATASRPEPQSRLMVAPVTLTGRPANRLAMRATLRLSSPAWLAQPRTTSSTACQSRPAWRAIKALSGNAARSSARIEDSDPP